MESFDREVETTREWMAGDRFARTSRLYSPRQIAEQQGTIPTDYTVARNAAERFYARLRELFAEKRSITSYGPTRPPRPSR